MTVAVAPAAAAERRLGIFAVVLAALGLSTGSTLVKLAGAPGSVVAFWRLLFGAAIWIGVLTATGTGPSAATIRRALPVGVAFGVNLAFFFTAVRATSVANVEFIAALTPIVMVPVAAAVLHERPQWRLLALALPAIVGVALVVFGSGGNSTGSRRGDLLALGAVAAWVTYLLLAKRRREGMALPELMAIVAVTAAVVVLPIGWSTGELTSLSAKGWAMCLLLAVITGTISHGLVLWAQQRVDLGTISVIQVSQPALAAGWAWLLLDETVTAVQALGMVVVLVSLAAFSLASARR